MLIRAFRVAGVLTGLAVLSCGPEPAQSDVETSQVTLSDLAADGTSEVLTHVEDMVISGDSVWVLNSNEPFFLVFDSAARFARAWGEQGGGPEEFGDPTSLLRHPESGEVWTYDAVRHEIRPLQPAATDGPVFIPAPSARHLVSLDFAGMGPGRPWIEFRPGDVVAASTDPSTPGTERIWRSALIGMGPTGETDTLLDVTRRSAGAVRDGGRTGSLFGPHPLWALCPDQTLVYWDQLRQSIDRLDPRGQLVSSTPLPPSREQAVTVEGLAGMMLDREAQLAPPDARMDSAQLRAALEVDLAGLGQQLSDVFPDYSALECDARSHSWIQPFDARNPRMGRGSLWIRIVRGELHHVRFPDEFTPFQFGEDEVWGVLTDSLDVPFVAGFALPGL